MLPPGASVLSSLLWLSAGAEAGGSGVQRLSSPSLLKWTRTCSLLPFVAVVSGSLPPLQKPISKRAALRPKRTGTGGKITWKNVGERERERVYERGQREEAFEYAVLLLLLLTFRCFFWILFPFLLNNFFPWPEARALFFLEFWTTHGRYPCIEIKDGGRRK